jgi:hypothetical protein
VPKENFGAFGAALPGTFYKRDALLPAEMRYFDGKPPETLRFGSASPQGRFTWVTETTEVVSGMYVILLKGPWGVDLDVMEISLAIDTPQSIVLVAGCSHPAVEGFGTRTAAKCAQVRRTDERWFHAAVVSSSAGQRPSYDRGACVRRGGLPGS